MMAEATKKPSRIALLAVCAAALLAGLTIGAAPAAVAQNQPQGQPQPKKPKKLPPGAKGFENYATRDASDKLATGGATRGPETDFDKAMKQGNDLYDAGKYREAAQQFARASKLKPDVFRAFYSLGAAHEAAGQFREAAAAYKMAVALKPDPLNDEPNIALFVQYALGNSQAAAGQHAEAVTVYRQVIEQIGRDSGGAARPYYNLALSLEALGRQQEAVDAYQQSASTFVKAVEAAAKAVEAGDLDPKVLAETKNAEAQTHYNLGVIHSRAERYEQAIESFKRALASRADYPEALYNLGLAYYLVDNNVGLVEQQKKLRAMNSPLASELAKLAGR